MIVADLFAKLGFKIDKKSQSGVDRALGAVKGALVGIAAFKGVKMMGGIINETRAMADNFAKMSKKVGVSVESLQQLEFAAQISGTNLGVLRTAMQRMSRTADDANQGLASAKENFDRLGVSLKNDKGELKSLDVLLTESADAFRAMDNPTERTALAVKLFGRSGAEMLPMLMEGTEGIKKLREEFTSLGGEIDAKTAAEFEVLNDNVHRMQAVFKGIKTQAVIALLPVLQDVANQVLAWVKANKQVFKQKLASFLKSLVKGLTAVVKVLVFTITHWEKLATIFVSAKLAGAISTLTLSMKTLGVVSLRAGMKAAAAWLAATLPILVLTALIAGLIYAAKSFWDFITGQDMDGTFFQEMVNVVADAIETVVNHFKKFFSWVNGKFAALTDTISDAMVSLDEWSGWSPIDQGAAGSSKRGEGRRRAAYEAQRDAFVERMRNEAANPMLGPPASAASSTSNSSVVNSFTINAPNADANAVGDIIQRKLDASVRAVPGSRRRVAK